MNDFTLDDLRGVLNRAAGEDGSFTFGDADAGLTYGELGYDSLVLLEAAAVISSTWGVQVPDEAVDIAATPRATVELVRGMRVAVPA